MDRSLQREPADDHGHQHIERHDPVEHRGAQRDPGDEQECGDSQDAPAENQDDVHGDVPSADLEPAVASRTGSTERVSAPRARTTRRSRARPCARILSTPAWSPASRTWRKSGWVDRRASTTRLPGTRDTISATTVRTMSDVVRRSTSMTALRGRRWN